MTFRLSNFQKKYIIELKQQSPLLHRFSICYYLKLQEYYLKIKGINTYIMTIMEHLKKRKDIKIVSNEKSYLNEHSINFVKINFLKSEIKCPQGNLFKNNEGVYSLGVGNINDLKKDIGLTYGLTSSPHLSLSDYIFLKYLDNSLIIIHSIERKRLSPLIEIIIKDTTKENNLIEEYLHAKEEKKGNEIYFVPI